MSQVSEYGRIQSEYATYTERQEIGKELKQIQQDIKPLRPKVAPAEDLEAERRAISAEVRQNMFLVQFALVILVASLAAYLILPSGWAHAVTFLLVCTGVAVGIFLRKG